MSDKLTAQDEVEAFALHLMRTYPDVLFFVGISQSADGKNQRNAYSNVSAEMVPEFVEYIMEATKDGARRDVTPEKN